MKKITEEWLTAALDDLMVIEKIVDEAHLTHIVAFHAQQAIEKSIKAVMEERDIDVPKIHNLLTLFSKIEGYTSYSADLDFLKTLDALYVDARYPGDFGLLPNGKPGFRRSERVLPYCQRATRSHQNRAERESEPKRFQRAQRSNILNVLNVSLELSDPTT